MYSGFAGEKRLPRYIAHDQRSNPNSPQIKPSSNSFQSHLVHRNEWRRRLLRFSKSIYITTTMWSDQEEQLICDDNTVCSVSTINRPETHWSIERPTGSAVEEEWLGLWSIYGPYPSTSWSDGLLFNGWRWVVVGRPLTKYRPHQPLSQ